MAYTLHDIHIQGAFAVDSVRSLSMEAGMNRHGRLRYEGFIDEQTAQNFMNQRANGQVTQVYLGDQLEFCGYLENYRVRVENQVYTVHITLISCTVAMDMESRCRFFQETAQKYSKVLARAYGESGVGNAIQVKGDQKLKRPIFQYLETDWRFTLRMAGELGMPVLPNLKADFPQLAVGAPKRQARQMDKPVEYYFDIHECLPSKRAGGNPRYWVNGDPSHALGDTVRILNDEFLVCEKHLRTMGGEVVATYVLAKESEYAVGAHANKRLAGLERRGTVTQVAGTQIQVQLDVEAKGTSDRFWLQYAPNTNNGMYSMPLVGEVVLVRWNSEQDANIVSTSAVRSNGSDLPGQANRQLHTEAEAQMHFFPNSLGFQVPENHVELAHDSGMAVSSAQDIVLYADGNIVLSAVFQNRISSPESILLYPEESERCVHMHSQEIHLIAEDISMMGDDEDAIQFKNLEGSASVTQEEGASLAGATPAYGNVME